jgi:hypothetical protein
LLKLFLKVYIILLKLFLKVYIILLKLFLKVYIILLKLLILNKNLSFCPLSFFYIILLKLFLKVYINKKLWKTQMTKNYMISTIGFGTKINNLYKEKFLFKIILNIKNYKELNENKSNFCRYY